MYKLGLIQMSCSHIINEDTIVISFLQLSVYLTTSAHVEPGIKPPACNAAAEVFQQFISYQGTR